MELFLIWAVVSWFLVLNSGVNKEVNVPSRLKKWLFLLMNDSNPESKPEREPVGKILQGMSSLTTQWLLLREPQTALSPVSLICKSLDHWHFIFTKQRSLQTTLLRMNDEYSTVCEIYHIHITLYIHSTCTCISKSSKDPS